jgi:hypothetical protein
MRPSASLDGQERDEVLADLAVARIDAERLEQTGETVVVCDQQPALVRVTVEEAVDDLRAFLAVHGLASPRLLRMCPQTIVATGRRKLHGTDVYVARTATPHRGDRRDCASLYTRRCDGCVAGLGDGCASAESTW